MTTKKGDNTSKPKKPSLGYPSRMRLAVILAAQWFPKTLFTRAVTSATLCEGGAIYSNRPPLDLAFQ